MRHGVGALAVVAIVLAGCSSATDTASSTSSTAVEDGLPFASTTTSRPREVTTPPQTEPPTTVPPPPATQGFVSPAPAPAAAAPARGNCHSSYPDTCIPPPPPDLDCGDVDARRFKVVPPDPHGFDSDSDGIGCESG